MLSSLGIVSAKLLVVSMLCTGGTKLEDASDTLGLVLWRKIVKQKEGCSWSMFQMKRPPPHLHSTQKGSHRFQNPENNTICLQITLIFAPLPGTYPSLFLIHLLKAVQRGWWCRVPCPVLVDTPKIVCRVGFSVPFPASDLVPFFLHGFTEVWTLAIGTLSSKPSFFIYVFCLPRPLLLLGCTWQEMRLPNWTCKPGSGLGVWKGG